MTTYQLPLLADFGSQGGLAGHVALVLQRGAKDHEVEDVLRLTFAVAAKEGDPRTVIAALDLLDRCLQALREAQGSPDRAAEDLLIGGK
jgi:hypothetical protein